MPTKPTNYPAWIGFEEWATSKKIDLNDAQVWLPWWECWLMSFRNTLTIYTLQ